jgi:Na+/H+-translocating membrane pyrophosphatase
VYRVVSAALRALRSAFSQERFAVAVAAVLAIFAATAALAIVGRAGVALFVALGVLVGAPLTAVTAALASACTAQASGGTHAASRLGFNASLTLALRAGGAVGIGTEAASTLGALGLFAATYFAEGGNARSVAAWSNIEDASLVVAGYALGAAAAALVVERAGAAYQVGAEAGRARASFDSDGLDPRDPALVAGLVGDHVGSVARGSASCFALSAVAVAAILAYAKSSGTEPLRLVALPLVIRSFGMVGSAAGILVARADEAQGQGLALLRGLLCAAAICLFGIVGASYWLGGERWLVVAGAGALGIAGAAVPSLASHFSTSRRSRPVRDAVEALRGGLSAAFGASLGHGLSRTAVPLFGVAGLVVAAGALGERALAPGGAVTTLAVFGLSFLSLAPFALGVLSAASVAHGARTTSALSKLDTESAWRLGRLDDVGREAAWLARPHLLAASAFAVLPALADVFGGLSLFELGAPLFSLWALAGGVLVLSQAGRSARAASGVAEEVGLEVKRQLGTPLEEGGRSSIFPEGYAPSYRACEELTQKAATSGLPVAAAFALGPLLPLGICLGLVYRVGGSRLAAAAFSTFVATAAVTALGAALAVEGARAVHGSARRLARLERETAGRAAPIAEDVLANILGIAAGPAASAQALLAAVFALVVLLSLH